MRDGSFYVCFDSDTEWMCDKSSRVLCCSTNFSMILQVAVILPLCRIGLLHLPEWKCREAGLLSVLLDNYRIASAGRESRCNGNRTRCGFVASALKFIRKLLGVVYIMQ